MLQKQLLLAAAFLLQVLTGWAQVFYQDSTASRDTVITKNDRALNFLVVGDWGRNGADHQKAVAAQMGKTAGLLGRDFIISTGDNFYPSGVNSELDPLFHYSFEEIYTDYALQWDWFLVLGNHDYKSNPDAQVAYSKISRRWKMPARYFSKKFSIYGNPKNQVLIAFVDTNPFIKEYYTNIEYGPNVRTQDTVAQKKWLEKLLSDPDPNIRWKIVVAHHPLFTGGGRTEGYDTKAVRNSFKALLDKYKVDMYIAGHEHSLQHILPPGQTHHFISGAGSEKTAVRLLPESKFAASEYGFMYFSITQDQALAYTIDHNGKVIYKATINK